jgi:hypothetical protein
MAKKSRDLTVTADLVVVDDTDHASILFAVVESLKGGPVSGVPVMAAPEPKPPEDTERTPAKEEVQAEAERVIEGALAKVVEEWKASGKEAKFHTPEWLEALQALWVHLARMKDAGYEITAIVKKETPDGVSS